jgi:exodeoxyribonuclease III
MKLYSWNVNGVRAVLKKDFLKWFGTVNADVVCLQETKAHPEQLPPELLLIDGYDVTYCAGERKGYSGVATFAKPKIKEKRFGFDMDPKFDNEGRILYTDFGTFILLNIYFPNGGRDLGRLDYKLAFYDACLDFCNDLVAQKKKVVICGDVNTSHNEIDLARPKANEKNTGFLRIERDWMDKLVDNGYVDTFRHLHPDKADSYSWWSYRAGARQKNVGWRLDYFFVSKNLIKKVKAADIHPDVMGSDHCPVSLELDF